MKRRRRRGTGYVEAMPDGRFRGRLPGNGGRLEPCATYEEAEGVLDAALLQIAEGAAAPVGGTTLASFGEEILKQRELRGMGSAKTDRSRWKTHILPAYFATWALGAIAPKDVRAWLDSMLLKKAAPGHGQRRARKARPLSRSVVKSTLNLLRVIFRAAHERELVDANPAEGVRLPRGEGETHDPWTYLLPEEQAALLTCEAIPLERRLLMAFAIGTGMREGEVWNLELRDVNVQAGRVIVRYGSKGKATKGKRLRRIPLFGLAHSAMVRRLALPAGPNPCGLAWPLPGGTRRQKGDPSWWRAALATAGIVRARPLPVPERAPGARGPARKARFEYTAPHRHDGRVPRWHDLRHTCGSSLVAGWWGRQWSLQEVKELLGHRSITTTERYAHLAESVLDAAGAATGLPHVDPTGRALGGPKCWSHLGDLNPRPTVYESSGFPSDITARGALAGVIVGLSVRARAALETLVRGGPAAYVSATEVLEELAALGNRLEEASPGAKESA